MLEGLSMYSDELMELLLAEEPVPRGADPRHRARRRAEPGVDAGLHGHGLSQQGRAAAAGRGRALPALAAGSPGQGQAVRRPRRKNCRSSADPTKPIVGMAFKMVEDPYGQLTFMRIYQGTIDKGEMYYNQRTGQKERFSRIVRDARRQARGHRQRRRRRHRGRAGRRLRQRRHLCRGAQVLHAGKHVRARAGHQDGHRPR